MTIQQIDFNRYLTTKPKIRTIHEQSKETTSNFIKEQQKFYKHNV